MGKTSNCLKMLQILSSGRVYKGQELADILETNIRNIAEYRTELEMAGYYIEGIPGKYGGYRLITQSVIPTVRLNEAEQRALSSGAMLTIISTLFWAFYVIRIERVREQ